MSPMSDQPVTLAVLTRALTVFHRDVILPDLQRVVSESESRLRNEMYTLHDSVLKKFDRLETEYASITIALERLEAKDGAVEKRLDTVEERLGQLERQYADLIAALHRLEERLSRLEGRVDQIAAAEERVAMRSEVDDLKARVEALRDEVRRLEQRIDPSA